MDDARAIQFLNQFGQWASGQRQIQGVALVGSYARGTATSTSDIDLIVLTDDPQQYLRDRSWVQRFGNAVRQDIERYGKVVSLRVRYEGDLEVEFGLTRPQWAKRPLDSGTQEVVAGGLKVLFERTSLLSDALAAC